MGAGYFLLALAMLLTAGHCCKGLHFMLQMEAQSQLSPNLLAQWESLKNVGIIHQIGHYGAEGCRGDLGMKLIKRRMQSYILIQYYYYYRWR